MSMNTQAMIKAKVINQLKILQNAQQINQFNRYAQT